MLRCALLTAAILSASLLTGCGLGTPATATATPQTMHLNLTGNVHGGQQPVAGARVFVFQGYNQGYGNASLDLIGHAPGEPGTAISQGGGLDSTYNAYYVPTNAAGGFTITGDYLCSGTGPVYLLATQGNPGLGSGKSNPALAELAVVANSCGGDLSSTPNIGITEQSTVTGIYALAGYMFAPNKLSAPSETLAQTGITNAVNTALALTNVATGAPLATTAAGGTVPVATINTLANIIAACVNSDGTGTPCSTLFNNATSTGVVGNGTTPTDTVTALLNIAHNPGANVAALFGLAASAPPYGGGLTTAPNDFTLAVSFPTFGGLISPGVPSVDAAGNVTFASTVGTTSTFLGTTYAPVRVSPLGASLNEFFIDTAPGIQTASDASGNTWIAHSSGGQVTTLPYPGSSSVEAQYTFNGKDDGHQLAIDTSGNVYISDYNNRRVYGLTNTGTSLGSVSNQNGDTGIALLNESNFVEYDYNFAGMTAGYTTLGGSEDGICGMAKCQNGGIATPTAFAVTSNAYLWTINDNNTLSGFDTTGATNGRAGGYLNGSPFSGGGLNTTIKSTTQPYPWLAIDGANNIWVGNYTGSVSEFSPAGLALTPNAGTTSAQPGGYFGVAPTCKSQGLAIDGSGNLWVSCDSATTPILEYIGIATPVATPLLPGNFGVRP